MRPEDRKRQADLELRKLKTRISLLESELSQARERLDQVKRVIRQSIYEMRGRSGISPELEGEEDGASDRGDFPQPGRPRRRAVVH